MAKNNNDPVWDALKELGKKHGAIIVENGKMKNYTVINKRKKIIARLVGVAAVVIWLLSVVVLLAVVLWVLL